VTAAQDQAGFLRALADHLDTHPHLATTWIQWRTHRGAELQLSSRHDPAALAAWAESINVDELNIDRMLSGAVHVHAVGRIGGHAVDVWAAVPALDDTGLAHDHIITLDVLRGLT
jgi:hypothetical protein